MAKPVATPDTAWRAGALGLLAVMSPEGQQRALASWARLGFTPELPVLGAALAAAPEPSDA